MNEMEPILMASTGGSLAPLTFSRNWTNPSDFPTYEPDEGTVRADLQCLHDEVKNWINNVLIQEINRIGALVSITRVEVLDDGTIQAWYTDGSTATLGPVLPDTLDIVRSLSCNHETDTWTITFHNGTTEEVRGGARLTLAEMEEDDTHQVVTAADKEKWNSMMPLAGGEFTGVVKGTVQPPDQSALRPSRLVTTEDQVPTVEGEIYWIYE